MNDFFFSNLAFAIEKSLFVRGYSPLFSSTENDQDKEDDCVKNFIRNRVEGVILVPSISANRSRRVIQHLLERKIPVVLVDRGVPGLKVTQVLSNNFQGGYDGVCYLLELGHRHIRIIDSGTDESMMHEMGPGYERINGARRAMLDAGFPFNDHLLITEKRPGIEVGYHGALALLRRTPQVTAIFALTDACAVGVLRAAFELNFHVPRDLSVMGFDDIPLAFHMIPRLTTLAQPTEKIGQTAAALLLRKIQEPDAPSETIMLPTQLVVRESTAPPSR